MSDHEDNVPTTTMDNFVVDEYQQQHYQQQQAQAHQADTDDDDQHQRAQTPQQFDANFASVRSHVEPVEELANTGLTEENVQGADKPTLGAAQRLLADRNIKYPVYAQTAGLLLSIIGLCILPLGDGPYMVGVDRVNLVWFVAVWSAVVCAISFVAILLNSKPMLLLSLILLSIASTILIVSSNLFSGLTRICNHCPGEHGPAMPFHPKDQPCPDYLGNCLHGRSLVVCGSVFQALAMFAFMLVVATTHASTMQQSSSVQVNLATD